MVLHLTWQGYSVEWTGNGTVLACHTTSAEKKSREPPWAKPIAAGVSSASFTAMVGIALMVRLKMTGQLRRKWQREKELDKNRQKGVPTEGLVTIVVTDVERYSGWSVGGWVGDESCRRPREASDGRVGMIMPGGTDILHYDTALFRQRPCHILPCHVFFHVHTGMVCNAAVKKNELPAASECLSCRVASLWWMGVC